MAPSHPVWVRGLKQIVKLSPIHNLCRTPCGCVDWNDHFELFVFILIVSHPVWVRGLKLLLNTGYHEVWYVAPRVGAWIETRHPNNQQYVYMSHPVWVRGLKHEYISPYHHPHHKSHPVWVRGLKHFLNASNSMWHTVAPRVGAWIETAHTRK